MALSRVELNVHPYGLGGGYVLSGSVQASFTDAFQYYPITSTTASLKMTMPFLSGATTLATTSSIASIMWQAGVPVYGPITEISQSAGYSIVYRGVVTADPGSYRL